jgi:peptidoglycan/LPS O-acetylase OafA/YrhL
MISATSAPPDSPAFDCIGVAPGAPGGAPSYFYKPELDMLRCFAFLGVFVVHSAQGYSIDFMVQHRVPLWAAKSGLGLAQAGMYGVDLFFVLSSYLITTLLLREKEARGALNIGAFYVRRILRIWPLYYCFIGLAALVPFLNPHHDFSLRYVLSFFFLMGNWSFIVWGAPATVAMPLWSVSVEEQFYLFWPPVVAKLSRRQIIFAAFIMICVANMVRPLAALTGERWIQLWMNTFGHLDSIAAGILVAVLCRGKILALKYETRIALIACAVCCLATRSYLSFYRTQFDGSVSLLGTLIGDPLTAPACAAILIAFIDLPLRWRVLQYLGKISYGLYVYHLTGLLIIDKLLPGGGAGALHACLRIVFALGLTIAISAVSYGVLERPFLNLKRRYTYIDSRPA